VLLSDQVIESLWAPLARQYLITHRESSDPLIDDCLELKIPSFIVVKETE